MSVVNFNFHPFAGWQEYFKQPMDTNQILESKISSRKIFENFNDNIKNVMRHSCILGRSVRLENIRVKVQPRHSKAKIFQSFSYFYLKDGKSDVNV